MKEFVRGYVIWKNDPNSDDTLDYMDEYEKYSDFINRGKLCTPWDNLM